LLGEEKKDHHGGTVPKKTEKEVNLRRRFIKNRDSEGSDQGSNRPQPPTID